MIGHDFPYLDTRDLNLDWLLKNMKQLLQDWATYQQTMNQNFANLQAAVDQFETDITTAFDNLHDYVEDYFDNLDVQQEINNKLNAMKLSGELAEIMDPLIATQTASWLSTHITNPSNPPVDTSLSVSGAAADAKVTGEKISILKDALNKTAIPIYKADISNTDDDVRQPFHIKTGDTVAIRTADGSNFAGADQLRFYDANGTLIDYVSTIPDTASIRVFTYQYADAFFIGITKVASATKNYIVENYSNGYNHDQDIETAQTDISQLKDALNKTSIPIYKAGISNTDDDLRQPFHIKTGDSVAIRTADGSNFTDADQLRFYDANGTLINYVTTIPYTASIRVFTYQYTEAFFIGITKVASATKNYIVENYSNGYNHDQDIETVQTDISQLQSEVEIINNDLYEQTVLLDDNALHSFPIERGTSFVITTSDGTTLPEGNPYLQCYDEDEQFITQFLCSSAYGTERTVTLTSGDAAYIKMYSVPSKTIKVYIPDKSKIVPQVRDIANIVGQNKIIVDASGSGDYTSFTEAIYETVDSGIDVLVKPGTYDIVAEYVALFGQSAVDSMADSDAAIFNGFQYGVRLRKRKVEFAPGSHLVCDWTGHTVDGTHRFSVLGVDYNVEIIGLDLDATATFYCIHDDYGISDPYTVKYENCRVIGHNIVNADCIGGGCKKYSRHILKNCYFDNNLTTSATVRYHNTNAAGAEPEIYVSDCYFNNWFTPRWYGEQTTKMKVYVNNCEARAIYKLAESSSFNVDNVELFKWCNTETDPVT